MLNIEWGQMDPKGNRRVNMGRSVNHTSLNKKYEREGWRVRVRDREGEREGRREGGRDVLHCAITDQIFTTSAPRAL